MAWHGQQGPDLGGTPSEEDVSAADAAHRVDLDPEEQVNYTEKRQAPGTPADAEDPDSTPGNDAESHPDQTGAP
jgi:hypothetical protein